MAPIKNNSRSKAKGLDEEYEEYKEKQRIERIRKTKVIGIILLVMLIGGKVVEKWLSDVETIPLNEGRTEYKNR